MTSPTPQEHLRDDGIDVPALYASHWRGMVRLAILLVDDMSTAEDVVQDAFLSLHRNAGSVRDSRAAAGYLRTSVVNGCRGQLRHRKVVRTKLEIVGRRSERDAVHETPVPEGDGEAITALRALPARMQEILVLRYWLDLSEAEIAATVGVSVGSVKSSASRGIAKLRDALGGAR